MGVVNNSNNGSIDGQTLVFTSQANHQRNDQVNLVEAAVA